MRIKILLSILLGLIFYAFQGVYFKKLDIFNRDLFQYFNSPLNSKIDDRIALVDIDVNTESFSNPLKHSEVEKLIEKIVETSPKHIILNIEPNEFSSNESEKRKLYSLLVKNNVNLNIFTKSKNSNANFSQDSIFTNFPNSFSYTLTIDSDSGYYSPRRLALKYYGEAQNSLLHTSLSNLKIDVKGIDYFKYSFERMNTRQLFHKFHPAKSFINLDSEEIIKSPNPKNELSGKIVIIGRVDEFTFMMGDNPFKLTDKPLANSTLKDSLTPIHHIIANQINALLVGDYVKYYGLKPINILIYIFFVFLIFWNLNAKTKLLLFILTLPTLIVLQILSYAFLSFYFDLNSLYALMFLLQYFVIPIIAFLIFKEQKTKQLEELNNVRIDVLFSVSEKVAHDIRSPLSVITLLTSKLQFQTEEQKNIFKNSVERIEQITENILTNYKTNADSDPMKNTDLFSLNSLVEAIVTEKKTIEPSIQYSFLQTEIISIFSNKLELTRVLSNIIDNSIHALNQQQNPKVEISIKNIGSNIQIDILDNGTGIPDSIMKILGTERFSTKLNKGNGIGLLHAKRSIEQMGGTLSINTVESAYTKIILILPRVQQV